jgi:hypothetical protein
MDESYQLVREIPSFFRTQKFITAFTRAHPVPILSQINPTHAIIPLPEDEL